MNNIPKPGEPSTRPNYLKESDEVEARQQQSHIHDCIHRLTELDINELNNPVLIGIVRNKDLDRGSREAVVEEAKTFASAKDDTKSNNFGLPEFDDTDNIVIRTIAPTPELVTGLIKQGTITSFIGKSKTYKSWHLMRLGLCLANGIDWLGMKCKPSKVLFLNPELIQAEYLLRLQSISKDLGVDTNPNFRSITLYRNSQDAEDVLESIGKCLDRDKFDVIIIDSIYRLYTDDIDENSNSDVKRFLGKLNKMAKKSNASIIFSHHSTKGDSSNKDSIDMASGAGSFGRWVDTAISTLRVGGKEDNKYCMQFDVRYNKMKPSIGFYANGPKLTVDNAFDVAEIKDKSKLTTKDILDTLKELGPCSVVRLQREVMKEKKVSERTFYNHWDKINDNRELMQFDGEKYTAI